MSTEDTILQLAKQLQSLAERVNRVAPYVRATLPSEMSGRIRTCPNGSGKWGEAHMGRSRSSRNQLTALMQEAKEAQNLVNEVLGT